MRTRVQCPRSQEQEPVVRHESYLLKFGCTLYRAEEVFALQENGADILISGKEWIAPFFWRSTELTPSWGTIDLEGTQASYTWHWFGETWTMRNRLTSQGVEVSLLCSWGKAQFHLRPTN